MLIYIDLETMRSLFAVVLSIAHLMVGWQQYYCAYVASFATSTTLLSRRNRESIVQVAAIKDLNVRQQSASGLTKLRFQASTNYVTKPPIEVPVPQKSSQSQLQGFLFRESIRDKILAGRQNRVELLKTPNRALYQIWQEETTYKGFAPPLPNDPILRVTSTGISFPGLALQLVATVGCKQVVRNNTGTNINNTGTPELQITLLGNQLQAEGPKPLVWVFNQLTAADKQPNNNSVNKRQRQRQPQLQLFPSQSNSRFTTHSTNTITCERTPSGGVVFRSVAELTIDVSFPSILLNILPVSKETAEKQGSDAILKVVSQDIGPCLDELRREYLSLVEKSKL